SLDVALKKISTMPENGLRREGKEGANSAMVATLTIESQHQQSISSVQLNPLGRSVDHAEIKRARERARYASLTLEQLYNRCARHRARYASMTDEQR
ncbi:hypothetical protein ABZP36_026719, partial [Zizania latifolia]